MKKTFLWRGYKSKAYQTDVFATVDDEDYDFVLRTHPQWRMHQQGYAVCGNQGKTILMHRLILGITDSAVHVDHDDHNKLNNVKSNLVAGTQTDNNRNSYFAGVGFHKAAGKWRAWTRYECKHIGLFETKEEASAAVTASELERLKR